MMVDAVDNGVNQYDTTEKPAYTDNTTLPGRVAKLNPSWNRPEVNPDVISTQEQFAKAMELAGADFLMILSHLKDSVFSARSVVEQAFSSRFSVHPSGRIMQLEPKCPWKDHLFEIEREHSCPDEHKVLYVIYFDNRLWMVQAMSITPSSFTCRKVLHTSWHGLREQELQAISGVSDAEFIHANGFIGGAWSFEGALSLALKSLEQAL